MGLTKIAWEEYENFKEVHTPDNLYIREHDGKYYTFFELGIASVRRVFEINTTDFEAYLSGERSGNDLLFKAQNDFWPPNVTQLEADKNFWRQYPEALTVNPEAQGLFTKPELKAILPEGAKILASSD